MQNAKAACKKLLIQLPVQSAVAVRTWSSWFLYDFMSLSHHSEGIFFTGLQEFIYW